MEEIIHIARNGTPWEQEQFVHLPRHWSISLFQRHTIWGGTSDICNFPPGPWLAREYLREGKLPLKFSQLGLRFPANTLTITDHIGTREIEIPTGFILGCLVGYFCFTNVYVVLEIGPDGRRIPSIQEPTAAWKRRWGDVNGKDS
ncbi:hypothetical protein ACUHMQ_06580 [Chitinimonas sp. PSY-7]|uniref:hypothetical protein n=1 Tax=Chitinimonas sp. PSY-7 TaxID=3459088 RepID=UPI0040401696